MNETFAPAQAEPTLNEPRSAKPAPGLLDTQTVTQVRHWTEQLFSFRVTRPRSLRFRSGEFVMIGLPGENGRPLLRAYSIASPDWDDELEFYSIKVPGGPLTSRLRHIEVGDPIIVKPKPVGTLVLDALLPGQRLWLLATGTGIAPFGAVARDLQTYERYDQVIVMHTCRTEAELGYGQDLFANIARDPLVGDKAAQQLVYYPTTTRQHGPRTGRITHNIASGKVMADLDLPRISALTDRAMVCGGMAFNKDVKHLLESLGLAQGANFSPQHYVLEKAFVGEGI